jgi:molybdenum cofactor cytidylyltransferase
VSVAAVVVAAGFSRRLGRPKQTIVLDGEMLVERAARVASEAGLTPVFVVVAEGAEFRADLERKGYRVLVNAEAAEGMASSIRVGIVAARVAGACGAVLMTCDQVAVTPELLRRLVAEPEVVTGSAYGGKVGVPAYFPAAGFDALLELRGDVGARDLLRGARAVDWDGLGFDVDTEEDLVGVREMMEGNPLPVLKYLKSSKDGT